jgi:hypothetical protein
VTDKTLLFRQVHPSWIQNNRVTSQAFKPTPKDECKLSVYDGDLITAEQSWKHHVASGLASAGVLAVTVDECATQDLPVFSSPAHFEEHAHIDFSALTPAQVKGSAKQLLRMAIERKWLHLA